MLPAFWPVAADISAVQLLPTSNARPKPPRRRQTTRVEEGTRLSMHFCAGLVLDPPRKDLEKAACSAVDALFEQLACRQIATFDDNVVDR